jgi:hypothetical protein
MPMRRELFIHFSFWFGFFVLISLIKHYFSLDFWPFWLGGILGTLLPDVDHVIYFYFINPQEFTSKKFDFLARKKDFGRMATLLYETRTERKGLIFHTVYFQVIFLILTFLLLTSSSSLFGRGLALAFALHLSVDELIDLVELKSFDNWLRFFKVELDLRKSEIYWVTTTLILLVLGFFF